MGVRRFVVGHQHQFLFCMSIAKQFDQKFGETLVPHAPTRAGVYRYLDEAGHVIYVGKAKNLRRRLSNYRNASRKKTHRKMRILVREAHSLIYETCEDERAALLRESELIRSLRPTYNVDGAFAFLYPSLGVGRWDKHVLICFTTCPEAYEHLPLAWYGCFRSRPRIKATFEALVDLLSLVGHIERSSRLPTHPRIKGSRLVGFRQLPDAVTDHVPRFFSGRDAGLPSALARRLLSKPRALRDAKRVEQALQQLKSFYEADAVRLHQALHAVGKRGAYVCQDERDTLFIQAGI